MTAFTDSPTNCTGKVSGTQADAKVNCCAKPCLVGFYPWGTLRIRNKSLTGNAFDRHLIEPVNMRFVRYFHGWEKGWATRVALRR